MVVKGTFAEVKIIIQTQGLVAVLRMVRYQVLPNTTSITMVRGRTVGAKSINVSKTVRLIVFESRPKPTLFPER